MEPTGTGASPKAGGAARSIGTAAVVLMLGNLTTSTLGFVRQTVVAKVFGAHFGTDAFTAASVLPQTFYDLTIGAAVSAALIPTFSEILERRGREELWTTFGSVLALAWLVLALVVAALIGLARPLMSLLLWGYRQRLQPGSFALSVEMARVLIPTVFFLGTSAVFLSALYSLRRFTAPAFATLLYHAGVIVAALVLARPLGILCLPIGALIGSAAQAAVQLPALLRAGLRLRLRLALTPEIRKIVALYAPVAAGLVVSVVGQFVDIGFKSLQQTGSIYAMQLATTLTQFPIGIVVAALSFAVLPSISVDAALDRMDQFKATLATGMRLVLFLTVPATLGYLALASPLISLLFQHGVFHASDTARTAAALDGYALQIPLVGLDQLLIFSFYARKNTVTPMLVGVAGVFIYVISAFLLGPRLHVFGLALANTIQNSLHALILLALLSLSIGSLRGHGVMRAAGKAVAAGAVMAAGAAGLAALLRTPYSAQHLAGQALMALAPLALGAVLYLLASALLRSQELTLVWGLVRRRV